MNGRLIPTDNVRPRFVQAWRDLAGRAAEPNPCHEPEMVLTAARHLDRPGSLVIAAVGPDDHLTACLPVWSDRYWSHLPVRSVSTWQHHYSYLGTPLVDRDEPVAAAGALLDLLSSSRRGHMLAIHNCPTGGPAAQALRTAAASRGSRAFADWEFERAIASSSDPSRVALRGKHLKDLRRTRRKLEAELGAPLALTELGPDDSTIAAFLKLEASSWKGFAGSALACRHEGFFRELCEGFGREDRIRFLSLQSAGNAVAMLCTMRADDQWYWFKIAFDETHGASSPGRQLMLDVTDQLTTAPAGTEFDSCADPQNQTINQLWTGRRGFATLLVPLPGRLARPLSVLAAASTHRHRDRGEQA
jgi:CelD/BcsL family acetyltransferase involved in cellulose biosynthesis